MTGPFAPAVGTWLERSGALRDTVRQEVVARQLSAHLGPVPLDVLDVGCGQGTQALRLAAAGHRVTGVEPDARMREAFAAGTAELTAEAASRVQLLDGDLDALADVVGGRHFDAVLCHGVLMYLADPATAVAALADRLAPGGLVSLLARNAEGMALRPALRGDWAGAQLLMDAADGDRAYVNELGVRARADRADELAALLVRHRVRLEAWYGVRCLTDATASGTTAPSDPGQLAALLDAEERAGRTDPYRRIGSLVHVLGRARTSAAARLRADHAPYDSDVVRALEAQVQAEYVVRYGGPDDTPVDPRQFDPPDGVFLVQRLGDEPVACGGFRRHDARSAEVKRMFVTRGHRGAGLGRALLAELERRARAAGYERLVLETGLPQPEAIGLYSSSGYAPIPTFGHYRDSPHSRCFAKAL